MKLLIVECIVIWKSGIDIGIGKNSWVGSCGVIRFSSLREEERLYLAVDLETEDVL